MLACPSCGATTLKAYFARRFTCGNCNADLTSNIGTVTMWEGGIGLFALWLPRTLLAQVFGDAWYVDWAIFLPLVLIAHFALLNALVEPVAASSK